MGRYEAFATRLREQMRAVGIRKNRELVQRLADVKCTVGENMVSRWVTGQARPWYDRLEALLDVLGIMEETERNEWKAAAYSAPDAENRDDDPTEPPAAHA